MTKDKLSDQFLSVFEENTGIIIKISRAFTHTSYDREDLINDIALELWKSFEKFKGDSKISTWIYRVALIKPLSYSTSTAIRIPKYQKSWVFQRLM